MGVKLYHSDNIPFNHNLNLSFCRQVLHKMASQYGKIFTIYLGGRRTVILSDHNVIKDAFLKHSNSFIDRPQDMFFIQEITKGMGKHTSHSSFVSVPVCAGGGVGVGAIRLASLTLTLLALVRGTEAGSSKSCDCIAISSTAKIVSSPVHPCIGSQSACTRLLFCASSEVETEV